MQTAELGSNVQSYDHACRVRIKHAELVRIKYAELGSNKQTVELGSNMQISDFSGVRELSGLKLH